MTGQHLKNRLQTCRPARDAAVTLPVTITSLPNPANLVPQELQALIKYIQLNKDTDSDWFTIQPKAGGQSWAGKCWCVVGLSIRSRMGGFMAVRIAFYGLEGRVAGAGGENR